MLTSQAWRRTRLLARGNSFRPSYGRPGHDAMLKAALMLTDLQVLANSRACEQRQCCLLSSIVRPLMMRPPSHAAHKSFYFARTNIFLLRTYLTSLHTRFSSTSSPSNSSELNMGQEFSKDGRATKIAESIPIVGYGAATVHGIAGNDEHAKRAAAKCTNSTVTTASTVAAGLVGGPPAAMAAGAAGAAAGTGIQHGISKKIDDRNVSPSVNDAKERAAADDDRYRSVPKSATYRSAGWRRTSVSVRSVEPSVTLVAWLLGRLPKRQGMAR
jgi:hypothetical protein